MIKKIVFFATILAIMLSQQVFANDTAMWRWIAVPQYTKAYPFKDGFAAVSNGIPAEHANGGYKEGLINTKGELVVPMDYDWFGKSHGQLVVSNTVNWEEGDTDGYGIAIEADGTQTITKDWSVDKEGKLTLIKPKNDDSNWRFEMFVGKDAMWFREDNGGGNIGVKNKVTGEIIIPAEYDQLTPFSEGLAIATKYNKGTGIIDSKNNIVIPLEYHIWHSFINDQLSSPDEHDDVLDMTGNNETRGISKDGKWGLINKKGEWVVPLTYESEISNSDMGESEDGVARYYGGLAPVKKDGKWGVIDVKGNLVVPIIYDEAHTYNGYASLLKDGKWGSVDQNNNIVVPFEYDQIKGYKDGIIIVSKNNYWGATDDKGNIVVPIIYDNMYAPYDGISVVKKNGRNGLVRDDGTVILPLLFDEIWDITENIACVKVGGKWGYAEMIQQEDNVKDLSKMASADKKFIIMQIGNSVANQSAFITHIDKNDEKVFPIVIDDRTYVPIRFVSDALNATVDWVQDEQKVIIKNSYKTIELVIGSNTAIVNGEPVEIDAAPIVQNERTLLPVRFVAEALNCKVEWNNENQTITILSLN